MPKNTEIIITYKSFYKGDKIEPADKLLIKKAQEAGKDAYAPYSGFHVGAAIRLKNGEIFTGNNQENAAYPSGLCAERVAVFSAASQKPGIPVEAIAISASKGKCKPSIPVPPCGACRQVLLEFEEKYNTPIKVIIKNSITGEIIMINSISDLLPFKFDKTFL